ncbi:MAG: phosphoribosylanthranilate isomerase [Lentisphaeraceae bacterium]|nr:phosphoribosylanthranilate isomerase [Lentisphaeraceae bacterium]
MKSKPFIKVCGITRKADLVCAVESGADAIGFIAFPKSPRYVCPSEVKYILDNCNVDDFLKVAVFVNADLEGIQQYLDVGIDVVQLHGDESKEFAASLDCEVWKAVRLHEKSQIDDYLEYPCTKFLIDSFVKDAKVPGGTGHLADWGLAVEFINKVGKEVLLAGGISSLNLAEAIEQVSPYGLDLSSSVESCPGIKDHQKIKKLFAEVNKLFS